MILDALNIVGEFSFLLHVDNLDNFYPLHEEVDWPWICEFHGSKVGNI